MKKLIFLIALINFIIFSSTGQPSIPNVEAKIKICGFVSATAFVQDQSFKFSNGQNAQWAVTKYDHGKYITGADIRNSRVKFILPKYKWIKGWTTSGVLEVDLFGGFNGTGAFSGQQQMFRVRMAYVQFKKNRWKIRVGQAWAPVFGIVPTSLSHIAFPLGYGSAGFIGWRFPGVYSYYELAPKDFKVQMRWDAAIFTGSWNGKGSNVNYETAGNINFPQFETRFNISGSSWKMYIAGHYDRKDMAGLDTDEKEILTGLAAEIGGEIKKGYVSIKGNAYTGKNMGHQLGAMTQIQTQNKDLNSQGAWVQLGVKLFRNISIFGFYGVENVDKDQAVQLFDNPRTKHVLINFMLMHRYEHTAIGIEYLHSDLTAGKDDQKYPGNQLSASVMYTF